MTYKITLYAVGSSDFIPITEEEFRRIGEAKKVLLLGIALEEKLDHVLENYAELERELLDMALEHSVFLGKIDELGDNGAHLTNRRIANLLTTTKLYLDQSLHGLSEVFGQDSEQYKNFKQATNREYDSVLGYRVMEALRNHAQHRSLPTHLISFPTSLDKSSASSGIRFYVVPSVEVAALEDDKKFKKVILRELLQVADKNGYVGLLPYLREYVEALERIHRQAREVVGPRLSQADELIAEYRTKGWDRFGKAVGLVALDSESQNRRAGKIGLGERLTTRRKDLEKKNRHLGTLSQHYVSSAV